MKIGLFFGSFNPIHVGHLIIAQYMLNEAGLDKIKFVVSPHNPLKQKDDLVDSALRLKMVALSIADNPKFELDSIEFSLPLPSFTYVTLEQLTEIYPEDELFIIMGSDTINNINHWKNFQAVLNYPILIYKRSETFTNPYPDRKNIRVFDSPVLNISATIIRQMLKENHSVKYLVSDEIISVLKKEVIL